jgi:hypothetical protein
MTRIATYVVVAALMMCGGHAARAERVIHCKADDPHGDQSEITVRQQEGGYKIGDHPAKVIFETEDRRKAVLYLVLRFKEDAYSSGLYVSVVTVDFQDVTVQDYAPPVETGIYARRGTYSYSGCRRLD